MIEGRQYSGRQALGARRNQEDEFAFHSDLGEADNRSHGLLAVLADGMGGHRGGGHASASAVKTFISAFNGGSGSGRERLERALYAANDKIRDDSKEEPELEGMGCTVVAVAFHDGGFEWISVGDSPLWLFRDGRLSRLNADHSMAPVLTASVERGEMTSEEAARHPHRNALRSALIGDKIPLVDVSAERVPVKNGDTVVLASDGLMTLPEAAIEATLGETAGDAEAVVEELIRAVEAARRRGQDNTTVVVVSPAAAGRPRSRARRWPWRR